MNLDRLQALAEAASPGPWTGDTGKWNEDDTHAPDLVVLRENGNTVARCYPGDVDGEPRPWRSRDECGQESRDASYIAAASPDVVLQLIAVARSALTLVGDPHLSGENCVRGETLPCPICELHIALAALDAEATS